jgi:hypothetical protein
MGKAVLIWQRGPGFEAQFSSRYLPKIPVSANLPIKKEPEDFEI